MKKLFALLAVLVMLCCTAAGAEETLYGPRFGCTLADFNGDWVFVYLLYQGERMDADALQMHAELHHQDGSGYVVFYNPDGTSERLELYCTIQEEPELGTMFLAYFLDPATGEVTENGMVCLLYEDGQLMYLMGDDRGGLYYYSFVPEAWLEEE